VENIKNKRFVEDLPEIYIMIIMNAVGSYSVKGLLGYWELHKLECILIERNNYYIIYIYKRFGITV